MGNKLEQKGVVFKKDGRKNEEHFRVRIKETNMESTIYVVEYGFFKMDISVLEINLPHYFAGEK